MRETRLSELYECCLRVLSIPPSFLLFLLLFSVVLFSVQYLLVCPQYVCMYTAETCRAQFHSDNQCRLYSLRIPLEVRRLSSRRDISLGMLRTLGFSRWSSRSHADRFLQLENRVLTCNVISYVPSAPLLSETRRASTMGVFWRRSLQSPSAVEMCRYLVNRHLFVIRDWKHGKCIKDTKDPFRKKMRMWKKKYLLLKRVNFLYIIVTINYSKIKFA